MPITPNKFNLSKLSVSELEEFRAKVLREKELQERFTKSFNNVMAGARQGHFGEDPTAPFQFMLETGFKEGKKETVNRLEAGEHVLMNSLLAKKQAKLGGSFTSSPLKAAKSVTQRLLASVATVFDMFVPTGETGDSILTFNPNISLQQRPQRGDAVFDEGNIREATIIGLATGRISKPADLFSKTADIDDARKMKAAFNKMLGLPEDQLALDAFRANLPGTAKVIDTIGTFAALMFVTRGLGGVSTAAIRGETAMSKVLLGLGQKGKLAAKAGLIGSGLGAGGNALWYSAHVLKDQTEFSGWELAQRALTGAGLGFFAMTVMMGRPYGGQVKAYHDATLATQGLSILSRAKNFGLAHKFSPGLTVGHMLQSGVTGAGFMTLEAMGRGVPAPEAIKAGLAEGVAWVGYDLLFARIGSTARWMAALTDYTKFNEKWLTALGRSKFGPSGLAHTDNVVKAAKTYQALGTMGIGAGIGAGIAGANDQNMLIGGILGAAAGAGVGIGFLDRTAPLMSKTLRNRLLRGEFNTLSKESSQELAELISHVSASEVAAGMDEASRNIFLRAVGGLTGFHLDRGARDKTLSALKAEAAKVHAQLLKIAPDMEMSADPRILVEQMRLASRLMQVRELEGQVTRQLTDIINRDALPFLYDTRPTAQQLLKQQLQLKQSTRLAKRAKDRLQRAQHQSHVVYLAREASNEAALQVRLQALRGVRAEARVDEYRKKVQELMDTRLVIANKSIESMSIDDVYKEIALASGETRNEAVRRIATGRQFRDFKPETAPGLSFIMENAAAREELAYLRAGGAKPGNPITKKVLRREGLSSAMRQDLKQFEAMDKEIDDLLAQFDAGIAISVHDIRAMMKRFGRGKVSGGTGGVITVDFPFIGTMSDFAAPLLKKAKLFLKDFKPGMVLAPIAVGASLSSADFIVTEDGFIESVDNQTGEPEMSWMGSKQGLAVLAALGMVLKPGFPLRIRGMAKAARALLQRQEARTFKKLGDTNREMIFILQRDGSVKTVTGDRLGIKIGPLTNLSERSIIFSLHNHPTNVKQIAEQGARFSLEQKRTMVIGDTIINTYPSPSDYAVAIQRGHTGFPMMFGIVTPIEGMITLVRRDRGTLGTNIQERSLQGGQLKTRVRAATAVAIASLLKQLKKAGKADELVQLNNRPYPPSIVGTHAILFGRDATEAIFDKHLARVEIAVQHNVSDQAFENIVVEALALTTTRPGPIAAIRAQQAAQLASHPQYSDISQKLADPINRAKLVKILTGAPPQRRRIAPKKPPVAPLGAREVREILPASVTPGEVTKPVYSLPDVQEWAARHGMKIVVGNNPAGQRVIRAITPEGLVAAEDISLKTMMGKLLTVSKQQVKAAADAQKGIHTINPGIVPGESGATAIELNIVGGNTVAGGILGYFISSIGAGALNNWLNDPDEGLTSTHLHMIGALGGFLGMRGAIGLGKIALTGQEKAIFELYKSATKQTKFDKKKIARMMGKSSSKPKKGETKKFEGGPSERQFLEGFSPDEQVQHLTERIAKITATVGRDKGDLRSHFERTLTKFIPSWIPEEKYDALQGIVISSARKLGFTEFESTAMWHGALLRATHDIERRSSSAKGHNLRLLAEFESSAMFGTGATLADIATIYRTANVLTGPPGVEISGAVRAARRNWKPTLTADSLELAALQATANGSRVELASQRGIVEPMNRGPGGLFPSWLAAPSTWLAAGRRMQQTEDTKTIGDMVVSLFQSVNNATNKILIVTKEWDGRLNNIFAGMRSEEREVVSHLMENAGAREAARLENPALFKAAIEFRQLLDDLADKLAIPKQERWQDYLPWIYNAKTLSEMKQKGFADPELMYVAMNTGVAEYKVFNHWRPRSANQPLGPIEMDPLVIGNIYINGAVRKIHIDQVLATHNADWFEKFSQVQPFFARDMAKWTLDAFGVPTGAHLRSLARIQNAGIRLQALARAASNYGFHTGSFIDAISKRYFEHLGKGIGRVADQYMFGVGVGRRFSNFARSFEFYSKLGGNFISPMVNLSQLYINTGTDIGIVNTLLGGTKFMGQVAVGRIAETGAKRAAKRAAKGLDPTTPQALLAAVNARFAGTEKLRLTREYGILSDASARQIDRMHETIRMNADVTIGTKIAGAVTGTGFGLLAGQLLDTDSRGGPAAGGFAVGVALTTSAVLGKRNTKRGVRIFRQGLEGVRTLMVGPFSAAETVNRLMTTGGGLLAASRASKVTTKAGRLAESVGQVVGEATLFGGTVVAVDQVINEPLTATTSSDVATFATIGGLLGLAGRKRTRGGRIRGELTEARRALEINPSLRQSAFDFVGKLKEMGPVTEKEVEAWWVRQLLDMTQFRFGREGRAEFFRSSTWGEVAGSLQSFTINQIEFMGSRLQSMYSSMFKNAAFRTGEVDIRFFRHIALIGGAGAALTALAGNMGSDKSYASWISRVGMGLIPYIRWNEAAETWQVSDVGNQIAGPFISDVFQASSTLWQLSTNPDAMRKWDEQLDDLSRELFTVFRQLPDILTQVGNGTHALGLEFQAERFRSQQFGMAGQIREIADAPVSGILGRAKSASGTFGGGGGGGTTSRPKRPFTERF